MDHLKAAFEIFKRHPLEWVLLGLVFGVVSQFGVGIFLVPNFIRIVRKAAGPVQQGTQSGEMFNIDSKDAVAAGQPPQINDLFNMDHISDDIVTSLVLILAIFAGLFACFIGAYVVYILGIWTMHLCADRLYAPVDCLKASFAHAKSNVGEVLLTVMIIGVVLTLVMIFTCGLGVLVTTPLMFIAMERFYAAHRENIIAAADAAGVPRLV
jgi:hypothetical protein